VNSASKLPPTAAPLLGGMNSGLMPFACTWCEGGNNGKNLRRLLELLVILSYLAHIQRAKERRLRNVFEASL
jgi:hypothetical protein